MSDNDREARLPQWAQQELKRLRLNLERAQAKLIAGPNDSDTFASPYINPRPLGRGEVIQFNLSSGRITARIRDGVLDVNGSESIVVYPKAGNAIEIEVRK